MRVGVGGSISKVSWKNEGVFVYILGYGGRDGTRLQKRGVGFWGASLTNSPCISKVLPMPQALGERR